MNPTLAIAPITALLCAAPLSAASSAGHSPFALQYLPADIWQRSKDDPALRDALVLEICRAVEGSPLATHEWKSLSAHSARRYGPDLEPPHIGYIKGMCLSFARSYCRLLAGEQVARDMAAPVRTGNPSDVLWVYRRALSRLGPSRDNSEVTNLRHLYTELVGYGSLESSGQYCTGRDLKNDESDTAETAESGILQTSYNTIEGFGHERIRRGIAALTAQYAAHPEKGFLWIFQEGSGCRWGHITQRFYGTGAGRQFQELSRFSPAFAAETSAISLRYHADDYVTSDYDKVEVLQECDHLLLQVQQLVARSPNHRGLTMALP